MLDLPGRTIDVAPTVGALFGLGAPTGGYDASARTEAFTGLPAPPADRGDAGGR